MKRIIVFFIITISFTTYSQNKTYFDSNWKETTKEKASYYRDLPKKENGIWLIKDYYISGEKQFVGHAKDSLATILEGDVTWYFKTGKVQSKIRYKNGKQIGFYTVVEGAKGSQKEGWNEKDLFFIDNSNAAPAEDAKGYNTDIYEYYYANTSIVASQHTNNVGYDDKFSFSLFFNKRGDTIGRLDKNKTSYKWKGKEVIFYEIEKEGKNEMNSIKQINTYSKGVITNTQYFNTKEEPIASGSLKNEKPFTGTFLKEACRFNKIQQYKNGNLLKETTYNKKDEKIGELSYEDNIPITGVFYNCISLRTYKNGKLHGKSIQYLYDGAESKEFEFIFKKGIEQGGYAIYQDESLLLEKGTYNKGIQTGEVLYYHNGAHSGDEFDHNYYLKANVKVKNNKPFITEFSQYNLDDNELLKIFKLEKNTTDKFTYLNNGYHSISLEDLNSDGFDDLGIEYNHHLHDITTYTYYLFNPKTNKYRHLPKLDNANTIEINKSEKTLKATFETATITYDFSKNIPIKKLMIEEVYHRELDTILVTQIFPISINKHPLLADDLPPINFIQKNSKQQIIKSYQKVNLKKEPFFITFSGLVNNKKPPYGFNVKVTASYNKDIFKKAIVNQREEETSIFGRANTFAAGGNNPFFIIDNNGHNILYYDNTPDDTLEYIKNINKKVLLLQFTIDKIHDGIKEKTISEINKPIYMIIYIDKNENLKIDKNEIHYITIVFK